MRSSILRNRFLERPNNIEEEMKVRNVTRKKIDKNRIRKDLYYVKTGVLDEILLKGIKLEKIGISETKIDAIKKSII